MPHKACAAALACLVLLMASQVRFLITIYLVPRLLAALPPSIAR
jgi:hypothetical protein